MIFFRCNREREEEPRQAEDSKTDVRCLSGSRRAFAASNPPVNKSKAGYFRAVVRVENAGKGGQGGRDITRMIRDFQSRFVRIEFGVGIGEKLQGSGFTTMMRQPCSVHSSNSRLGAEIIVIA
jgi:hypothetical protein